MKSISVEESRKIILNNKDNDNFVILDVRTPEEYGEGCLRKAVNIDLFSSDFNEQIKGLDRGKKYLIYCRSGSRSLEVLEIMKKLGFNFVYEMGGGIMEWEEKGLEIGDKFVGELR